LYFHAKSANHPAQKKGVLLSLTPCTETLWRRQPG
jgi:hypothetical protein